MSFKNIALVTGANKGIGYEIVKALLESDKPYHVFIGSRSLERGQEAAATLQKECADSSNTVEVIEVDISSDSSIAKAFEIVKASVGRIDTLINNAGITKDLDRIRGKVSLRESLTGSYDVNVAGTHVMTFTFMPLLLQSTDPRLIFITGLGTFDQCARGDFPLPPLERGWLKKMEFETVGYRCTKTALNMLMLDYHYKLQKDGVKVWCIRPGFLATDLGDAKEMVAAQGAGHPSIGGRLVRSVVEGERDADTGKYVVKDRIQAF
ncbi:hypothetical protein V500_06094 [Pseudogymnoascus sp. VKM F-4518 (FW-2643)]|nr:hypothetical protein V500_06094 [Pseudogymnoascus sp. VKM F-4518 (FW-2643)]